MKKVFIAAVLALVSGGLSAQEFTVITTIESIVPMGLGRSRIVDAQTEMNAADFTTQRTDGKKSDQGDVKRRDLKIDEFEETKMLNFYSGTGINFQNVASNDALISSKLTQMAKDGWKLSHVVSGVESDSGDGDGKGIFITRYVFMRE